VRASVPEASAEPSGSSAEPLDRVEPTCANVDGRAIGLHAAAIRRIARSAASRANGFKTTSTVTKER
jgi:hypothetical protein